MRTSLVLAAIVGVAAAVHAALALRSPVPWIIPDELVYSELAKSIGDFDSPSVRDEFSLAYGVTYPLLVAPMWAVFDNITVAYTAAKVLNALVMSLAALPAYGLARRFTTSGYATLVAAMTVAVPSLLYSGVLLTEVALYPAFTFALYAITVAVDSGRTRDQMLAFGAIFVATSIKALAVLLFPAYLGAILLFVALERRASSASRARLGSYSASWLGVAFVGTISALLVVLGARPLGIYQVVVKNIEWSRVPWWALLHVSELDLFVALVPLAASITVVVHGCRRAGLREQRLFVSVVAAVVALLIAAVAAYSSKAHAGAPGFSPTDARLHERSTFLLAPLLFVGLALWLERLDRRAWTNAVTMSAAVALIPFLAGAETDGNVRFQALALVPWREHAAATLWPAGLIASAVVIGAITLCVVRLRLARGLVVAPVLIMFGLVTLLAHQSTVQASTWTRDQSAGGALDWIDRAVPDGSSVSVLWAELPGRSFVDLDGRHRVLFVGEFFNRSVGRVYELGAPLPYNLPSVTARLERGVVVLESGAVAVLGEYVLAPCQVRVPGERIATDDVTGAVLYRVTGPVRARVDMSACGDRWST